MIASNRRDFLKSVSVAGAALSATRPIPARAASPVAAGAHDGAGAPLVRHAALGGALVDDPYAHVDWDAVQHVASASHLHVTTQGRLDQVYDQMKLRHLAISNYYPSAPYYPIEAMKADHFIRQSFGVVRHGRYGDGPIDWNRVISDANSGWMDELSPEARALLPLRTGGRLFDRVPADVIVAPNAEHHGFTDTPLHLCAPGSLYSSGAFDVDQRFGLRAHGYDLGTGLPWRDVFPKVFEQLLFPDGGGVTINHPTWSKLDFEQVCQFLDFDSRVLGIEVYNDAGATAFGDPTLGWAVELWDRILTSGRRCLGFFSPDKCANGKNILLVPRFSEHECLKAYRAGAFYGTNGDPKFSFGRIQIIDDRISVRVRKDGAPVISGGSDNRLIVNVTTNAARRRINARWNEPFNIDIPKDERDRPSVSFIRIEAVDLDAGQVLYSQPIRFRAAP